MYQINDLEEKLGKVMRGKFGFRESLKENEILVEDI